ncbi:dTDP-4-amino-4,6-dideoxygalactose transaminase [Geosporobacter ferrireducens]|uniref:dTDP-4-amino-4,6-dideoxygalactose transaminase n=1 Tax=Geosporobacter ferrireducens TaxID=1424294 RepID=A0A1D8GGH3_9FIRM|nr:dTDP-4-amino-4,6-dideoxygalactose transaminase [Geosporobacter ferrireducens]AOT70022.1 dTDP-4-amino-4,6-dideoxygalactose transaminase [Geosporobacter ferrireducens]MTI53433.1 dTDP-4-amino-4,6-dideoxygalactose transaminase [Geosporobacter ferrireducens]
MIPFNKPYFSNNEYRYIKNVIDSGYVSGDHNYTQKCNEYIQQNFAVSKVLLTTSCSISLDMAAILLDLKKGDEVIMPSYNFVSTANAIVQKGAIPVFAEVTSDTLNIDPVDIERRITKRTKAIFPVHYAGVSCDMERITELAKKYKLKIVEDAAQGVYAKYKDKYLGTIGDIGTYSFHETKNYSCGEGGAILINNSEELARRAEIIREKGTNRSQFFRGEVDKYTWVDIGSSYLISDILAAMLYAQLEKLEEIQEKRKTVHDRYYSGLVELQNRERIRLPVIPSYCTTNYHIFYILLPTEEKRNDLMKYLKNRKIGATFHYIPLHISPMGMSLGYKHGDLLITENLSSRLLRLPIYPNLSQEEIQYVVESIHDWSKTI